MPGGKLVAPVSISQKFAVPAVPAPAESSRQSNPLTVPLAWSFWNVLLEASEKAKNPFERLSFAWLLSRIALVVV